MQEICIREFVRIKRKPREHSIHSLLSASVVRQNTFTPMWYLKYVARDFERSLGDLEIEKDNGTTPIDILDDVNIEVLSMTKDLGNSRIRTTTQKAQGRHIVDTFEKDHQGSSVTIFTDGSVEGGDIGLGACVAIFLPLDMNDEEQIASEAFSILTKSVEVVSH